MAAVQHRRRLRDCGSTRIAVGGSAGVVLGLGVAGGSQIDGRGTLYPRSGHLDLGERRRPTGSAACADIGSETNAPAMSVGMSTAPTVRSDTPRVRDCTCDIVVAFRSSMTRPLGRPTLTKSHHDRGAPVFPSRSLLDSPRSRRGATSRSDSTITSTLVGVCPSLKAADDGRDARDLRRSAGLGARRRARGSDSPPAGWSTAPRVRFEEVPHQR